MKLLLRIINKKSIITLIIIIVAIFLILLRTIKYSIDITNVYYPIKLSYIYYELIKSNVFTLCLIPIFLFLMKNIYTFLYKYKVIIKYDDLYLWWKKVFFNTICLSIIYTIIINLIVLIESCIKIGFSKEIYINLYIYLAISIFTQIAFFLMLGIFMNILMFIKKKNYIWFISITITILFTDNLFSTLKLFDLNIKNVLFFTLQDNIMKYSNNLLILGIIIFINAITYEIGFNIIKKKDIYWRE
ncbi:hypothetical protein SAMN05421842_11769 [Clostridium uliginosum]|uniref:Uncharacterized protein n=1 Tax=Clostridium uliginosum TaxID=119641 RepID=A0A1I1NZC4_9CLOT|nr:hypothetical protein SAMN05421842_11769 [Clostridium uliginosum]